MRLHTNTTGGWVGAGLDRFVGRGGEIQEKWVHSCQKHVKIEKNEAKRKQGKDYRDQEGTHLHTTQVPEAVATWRGQEVISIPS